jgi:hypothetical protein
MIGPVRSPLSLLGPVGVLCICYISVCYWREICGNGWAECGNFKIADTGQIASIMCQVVNATLKARGRGCGIQSGHRISKLDRRVGFV